MQSNTNHQLTVTVNFEEYSRFAARFNGKNELADLFVKQSACTWMFIGSKGRCVELIQELRNLVVECPLVELTFQVNGSLA